MLFQATMGPESHLAAAFALGGPSGVLVGAGSAIAAHAVPRQFREAAHRTRCAGKRAASECVALDGVFAGDAAASEQTDRARMNRST